MKRFSIAFLMMIVLLVAADFAIVRALWNTHYPYLIEIAILTLLMINLLFLFGGRVKEVRDGELYWLGFEAGGWVMVFLVASCTWIFPETVMSPVKWVDTYDGMIPGTPAEIAFLISFSVVLYTMPQLLVATAAGLFFSKYRIVVSIERRQPSTIEPVEAHAQPADVR